MTGIELAEMMVNRWAQKGLPQTTQPLTCIVSAAVEPHLADEAKAKGFHFLRKPVNVGRLRALLMQASSNLKQ